MKELTKYLLLAVMFLSIFGCSNKEETPSNKQNTQRNEVTLKIYNFKVEMAEQLAELVKEYEGNKPGIKIEIETCGGGCDYSAELKTKFSSGDQPDIFFVAGYSDLDLWIDHLEDLSSQPWVDDLVDIAKEPMSKEGKLYGMPLNLEGWGYIYNKDLFAQAGIEEVPKTFSELEAAAKKLQSAGHTPFENGYGEWWILGNHFLNTAFAQQNNPEDYIKAVKLKKEKFSENNHFNEWGDLLDLTIKYGQENPLQTDYNTQVTSFANGKAAMIQQGNWIQLQLLDLNPNLNYGFLPIPINDDKKKMDRLPIGVPNNWVIYKHSSVKEEAKEFLNWMVTSETGKKYLVEEFKFIPAFENIPVDEAELGPLGSDLLTYIQEEKTIPWMWQKYPGYEVNTFKMGEVIQTYIGGEITEEEMLRQFQLIWEELSDQEVMIQE